MWPQFKTNCLFIENNYLGLYDYYYLENEISRKLCNVFIYLLLFFSICAIILLLKVKKAGRNFRGLFFRFVHFFIVLFSLIMFCFVCQVICSNVYRADKQLFWKGETTSGIEDLLGIGNSRPFTP